MKDKGDTTIYEHLGDVYNSKEVFDKAEEFWSKSLELDPEKRGCKNQVKQNSEKNKVNTCIIFAPAKVNLFLEILNKRKDGYHNIRTIFQTINLFDILYLKESSSGIKLHCTDSSIPNDNRNLAYKSAKL